MQLFFEAGASLFERHLAQIFIADREEVPHDVRGRRLFGEKLHARRRRMNAQQQGFKIETCRSGDHDLAVDDASLRQGSSERREQLRKIAVHRLLVAALKKHLVAVAKDERAEPVPLRLEEPSVIQRQSIRRGGQHRRERRLKWKVHWTVCSAGREEAT